MNLSRSLYYISELNTCDISKNRYVKMTDRSMGYNKEYPTMHNFGIPIHTNPCSHSVNKSIYDLDYVILHSLK